MLTFQTKKTIELEYERLLKRITSAIVGSVSDINNIIDLQTTLNNFKFNDTELTGLVSQFIGRIYKDNERTWRAEMNKSQEIYSILNEQVIESNALVTLQNLIVENVGYIKDIPKDLSKQISNEILDKTYKGIRAENLIQDIQNKLPNIGENKARLIARTQVSASQSALTESRSKALGINWYIWRTSHDERVRTSHSHMENVICNYSDPPSPEALINKKSYGTYSPGNTFNCRCYAQPIINIDRISFPAKVYYSGQIMRMSKSQFLEII